ncbi:MAG: hypothetical protein PUC34_02140 [Paludibacteraceae bacterium]|nr:hypothetical protein [Paludibacteraceae bacterium]
MDTIFIADTCISQVNSIAPIPVTVETGGWEMASVIITAVFAIANLILAISVFRLDRASSEKKAEAERRLTMFKTLVLDAKINSFHESIKSMREILDTLPKSDNDIEKKQEINDALRAHFYELTVDFIDLLMAIDYKNLYEPIRDKSQNLQDELTKAIFDEGIRLSHRPKFEERILSPMSKMQTDIIKILYGYDGNVK